MRIYEHVIIEVCNEVLVLFAPHRVLAGRHKKDETRLDKIYTELARNVINGRAETVLSKRVFSRKC